MKNLNVKISDSNLIESLKAKHSKLDKVIENLQNSYITDDDIKVLKKEKLKMKDRINSLSN